MCICDCTPHLLREYSSNIVVGECFASSQGVCSVLVPILYKTLRDNLANNTHLNKTRLADSCPHINRVVLPQFVAMLVHNVLDEETWAKKGVGNACFLNVLLDFGMGHKFDVFDA